MVGVGSDTAHLFKGENCFHVRVNLGSSYYQNGAELATHSSILAWRISWTEEPGRLQSMGLQRVGQDRATNTLLSENKSSDGFHTASERSNSVEENSYDL